ncbi:hypothetical protein ADUPG1_000127 [Aduncisulcus paluster]|uniref:Uncharacterized protein n=1 Tax=Aduncisulcus paluster TaxID=2918883 RepID=A0ABQ5K543_9EUKA|nr:hypothetical protein ADUPG1_000127 [Aduncisulcus paluster]
MSSPSEPDIEIIVPEFINEGELASIPIPRDDPTIVSPDIRTTKGINTTGGRRGDGFDGFDMASESQKILNGEGCIRSGAISTLFSVFADIDRMIKAISV